MDAPLPDPTPAPAPTPALGDEPGRRSGRRLGRASEFAAVPGTARHQEQLIEVVGRYGLGQSLREIADATGMSYGKVHKVLTESGIPRRPRGRPHGPRVPRGGGDAVSDTGSSTP